MIIMRAGQKDGSSEVFAGPSDIPIELYFVDHNRSLR